MSDRHPDSDHELVRKAHRLEDEPGEAIEDPIAIQELLEAPGKPEISDIDHDAHGGWPQYQEGYEFDHTPEEVMDNRTDVERALDKHDLEL